MRADYRSVGQGGMGLTVPVISSSERCPGNGTSVRFGDVAHQTGFPSAQGEAARMTDSELFTFERQLIGIAANVSIGIIQGTELALVILIFLATRFDVEPEVMIAAGSKTETRACVIVACLHGRHATFGHL